MSRLIVTDLPTQISQEALKKHFSVKGNITDVKLIYKNGQFRRYGFVGFEKAEDAAVACNYFNNTYIKQAKVTVKICDEFDNVHKPVSWREKNQARKEAEKQVKLNNNVVNEEKSPTKKEKKKVSSGVETFLQSHASDPEFREFMKVNKTEAEALEEKVGKKKKKKKKKKSKSDVEDQVEENEENNDDVNEEISRKKKKKKSKTDVSDDNEVSGGSDDESVDTAKKEDMSDLDYLQSLKKKSEPENAVPDKEKSEPANSVTGKVKEKKSQPLTQMYTITIRTKERCKIRQQGSKVFTKQSVKDFLKPLKWHSLRIPPKYKYVAYVGFKDERNMRRALQKDKSFLNGARVTVMKFEERIQEENDPDRRRKNAPWSASEERLKGAEPVAESGRLFVRNLWYSVTEEDLRELFEKYGSVSDINLPICKMTRRIMGYAFITYLFPEHAVQAMSDLDGKSLKGRVLHILPSLPKEENKEREGESFQEKKEKEKKATAGSWHNWNTLFMGSGAVIDVMAEKYKKSKQEILNAEGKQSVAVNLALGESQIVDETRRFLEENEVSLEAFTSPGVQRSSTVILVKNLPANTKAQELSKIFGRYGELGRVILPPSGVTAIVEYLDPGEAKKGFRGLAYSKFHYLPLYLEWAPQLVFKSEYKPSDTKRKLETDTTPEVEGNVENNTDNIKSEDTDTKEPPVEPEESKPALPPPEPETTVYIKNLNFTTTEDILRAHFNKRVGLVHSVLIAKKRNLSQGYGFVQFVKRKDAQKAIREMQDTILEDKNIQLKMSEKILATPSVKSARMMHDYGKQNSTKIMVKNVPFEATRKEVRQLFATFGELKTVRLPNKPGTEDHRGFGFIDFLTREEAKKAFEALCHSTHLYGRRLILEWAKDDETVDELREKTAQQFLNSGSGPPLKKKKLQESLPNRMQFGDDD